MDINFVDDSQQSQEDLVYYVPIDYKYDPNILEVENASLSPIGRKSNDLVTNMIEDNFNLYEQPHTWRSLRKRTAIQKKPYSLERIKHRQLLEGYDISSFEQLSNELVIPEVNSNDDVSIGDDAPDYTDIVSVESDILEECNEINFENTKHQSDGAKKLGQLSEHDGESINTDNIYFRGRKIDISKGYRGIMPKIAWDKELFERHNATANMRRKRSQKYTVANHKGVAQKKQNVQKTKQDSVLLSELLVSDSDEVEINLCNLPSSETRKNNTINLNQMKNLSNYFQEKYDNQYFSDDKSESDIEIISFKPKNYKNDLNIPHHFPKESKQSIFVNANDDNIIIKEKDILDFMLNTSKRVQQKKTNSVKNSIQNALDLSKKDYSRKGVNCLGFVRKISLKRIQQKKKKQNHKLGNQSVATLHENLNLKEKKRKTNQYVYNRAPSKKFSTIIEAPGSKIGMVFNNNGDYRSSEETVIHNTSNYAPTYSNLLKVVHNKSSLKPVDVVNIHLSKKIFTLSRLNSQSLNESLKDLFEEILTVGASDDDLFEMSTLLTEFFYQLNLPSARESISDFHKKFRLKVSTNRAISKPIHFYLIALCQLIFLETTWYSNIAPSIKEETETKIINHIVSFFRLLDICYENVIKQQKDLLYESFDILATIIDELKKKQQLWSLLEEQNFSSPISLILCETFPTKDAKWSIFALKPSYIEMSEIVKSIQYCHKVCKWELNEKILVKLHNILKRRRFADFEEEHQLSKKNKIIDVFTKTTTFQPTIFNTYLTFIRTSKISNLLMEKITPVGDIAKGDGKSVLINRLNLLLLLADKSDLNIERRFEPIFSKLIESDYVRNMESEDFENTVSSLINTIFILVDNNNSKKLLIKCKYLSRLLHNLLDTKSSKTKIYGSFIKRIALKFSTYEKQTKKSLLKQLYLIFNNMLEEKYLMTNVFLLLKLFSENFDSFSAQWINSTIFQVIKNKIGDSKEWIDFYCLFGQYLIQKNVFSWWSFAIYNGLQNNTSLKMYFNGKIIETCDDQLFINLKEDLFNLLIEELPCYEDENFQFFLKNLLRRQSGIYFEVLQNNFVNKWSFWRHFLNILSKHISSKMVSGLVLKLNLLSQNKVIDNDVMEKIMKFLDNNCYVNLKDDFNFNELKCNLGIVTNETQHIEFRNILLSLSSIEEQVRYLESFCIKCASNFDLRDRMLFLSRTSNSNKVNLYALLVAIIKFNDVYFCSDFYTEKVKVIDIFMRILNEINALRFYSFDDKEFQELLSLNEILSHYFSKALYERKPIEFHRFQTNLLHLTNGFSEYRKVLASSQIYIDGGATTRLSGSFSGQNESTAFSLRKILTTTTYSNWFSNYEVQYTSNDDNKKFIELLNAQNLNISQPT